MRVNKMLTGILLVFLMIAFASESFAWWGKRDLPAPEQRIERIAKRLELTEEQKSRFKAHREKTKEDMEGLRGEIRETGKKLKTELEKDHPSRATLHDLIRKINQKQAEMQIKRMDSMLELREMLTPDQREKFKQMLDVRKPPRGKRPPRKR